MILYSKFETWDLRLEPELNIQYTYSPKTWPNFWTFRRRVMCYLYVLRDRDWGRHRERRGELMRGRGPVSSCQSDLTLCAGDTRGRGRRPDTTGGQRSESAVSPGEERENLWSDWDKSHSHIIKYYGLNSTGAFSAICNDMKEEGFILFKVYYFQFYY